MCMLLDTECLVLLLEHYADIYIKCRSILSESSIICILYIAACPLSILWGHICRSVFRIKILNAEETSAEVHLSLEITVAVNHLKTRYACKACNLGVIRTECRSDMNDTCTVLCSHIVTRNHLESTLARIEPRNELLIADACKLASLKRTFKHLERHELVARLVILKSDIRSLRIKMSVYEGLCHDIKCRLACVWIERKNADIVDVRSYAKCSI